MTTRQEGGADQDPPGGIPAGRIWIGFDGRRPCGAAETREQILRVEQLACALVTPDGTPLGWESLDDPEEPMTPFQLILRDREQRVDRRMCVAGRPTFAVVTVQEDRAVRLELYEDPGNPVCVLDLRARGLPDDMPLTCQDDPAGGGDHGR